MENLTEVIVFTSIVYLIIKNRVHQKKIEWLKKTYDRNFDLAHDILNSLNDKTKNDEKFKLEKDGLRKFYSPDEYQKSTESLERMQKMLKESIKHNSSIN